MVGKQGSGPRETMSYRMQGIFCPSVHAYIPQSLWTRRLGLGVQGLGSWLWPAGFGLCTLTSAFKAWPWDPGGWTDGWMDGQTEERMDKISPAFYRTFSLWGHCSAY